MHEATKYEQIYQFYQCYKFPSILYLIQKIISGNNFFTFFFTSTEMQMKHSVTYFLVTSVYLSHPIIWGIYPALSEHIIQYGIFLFKIFLSHGAVWLIYITKNIVNVWKCLLNSNKIDLYLILLNIYVKYIGTFFLFEWLCVKKHISIN